MTRFPASLDAQGRLVTRLVGYGVGMGVPIVLGVSFAIGFSAPWLLLFPVPFVLAFGLPGLLRPLGFAVNAGELLILRPIGPIRVPLSRLAAVNRLATAPPGPTVGLARVYGIHGTFGSFWNRTWGRYRAYVTDPRNAVELRFEDDRRLIVSPDDPEGFVAAVREAARSAVPEDPGVGDGPRPASESTPSGWAALLGVESAALGIALILPFMPSRTGPGTTRAADWLFEDPTYLANVVVGFLMVNAVLGVLGVLLGILAGRK